MTDSKNSTQPCKFCQNPVAPNADLCPKCGGKKPYPNNAASSGSGWLVLIIIVVVIGWYVIDSLDLGFDSSPRSSQNARIDTRISAASTAQLDKIADGLQADCTLLRYAAWMQKSSTHNNAYYVVACFDGPRIPNIHGAWFITGDPDDLSGMILSANAQAARYSEWPDESKMKYGAYMSYECKELLAHARLKKP